MGRRPWLESINRFGEGFIEIGEGKVKVSELSK